MGDLDGRERVTRLGRLNSKFKIQIKTTLAEELYHTENYMMIVEGMNNHVAFYVENADLEWMREGDLKAEITQSDALQQMAEFSSYFLFFVQSTISAPATRYLWEKRNTASGVFSSSNLNRSTSLPFRLPRAGYYEL